MSPNKINEITRQSEYLKKEEQNTKNEQIGEVVGETVGTLAGGAMGAKFGAAIGTAIAPGIGTVIGTVLGGAVGSFAASSAGKAVGKFVGRNYNRAKDFIFGSDNMTNSDKSQLNYEEEKIGITSINDPQIQQKAAFATVKIHDILVSIWHHLNGKQSNGLSKNKGVLGTLGKLATLPLGIGGNIARGALNAFSEPLFSNSSNEKSIREQYVSSTYGSLYNAPNVPSPMAENTIKSLPVIGKPTYIKNSDSHRGINGKIEIPDINLNISGTLKLTSDSKSVDIDIRKLLDNPQFKDSIVKMVKDGLDRNQGAGKINRNSTSNQRTSSGYKSK